MHKVIHPHISSDSRVCGGSPVIVGTRFPVRSVVNYILRHGYTPEELVHRFTHLSLAQRAFHLTPRTLKHLFS